MYKMLIVDDNPADRRGISSLFDWGQLGIQIAGAFPNGERALEVIKEQAVDIVLTDIVMPIMDGIELSEHLKRYYPRVKVIFMSCYSDFDYVKSAMDMDIYAYVLKPIVPGELMKAIQKILAEYQDEQKKQTEKDAMIKQMKDMLPMVQEQFLRELLLGNCFEPEEINKRMEYLQLAVGYEGSFYVVSLVIDDYEKQTVHLSAEELYYISYSIKHAVASFGSTETVILPVQFSSREYSVLVYKKAGLDVHKPLDIMDLAVGIYTAVLCEVKLSATIGISKVSREITKVHELYRQTMDTVKTQFYGGSNPIIRYEEIESGRYASLDQTVNMEELFREIKELIVLGNERADMEFWDRYFQIENTVLPESYIKSLTFTIVSMSAITMTELGCSFSDVFGNDAVIWEKLGKFTTIVNLKQWLLNLLQAMRKYLSERVRSRDLKVVDMVKHIIRECYSEQITVEDIAKAVYLSQSYANSIVKKETGKSIFDHLQEYRLEMAKKLLMDPECKVAVVSEKVGYENKSYFTLVFKKHMGLTPSEFKARFNPAGENG